MRSMASQATGASSGNSATLAPSAWLQTQTAPPARQTPAWVYLGRTYTALGRTADREALEARFTAATGEPWPE